MEFVLAVAGTVIGGVILFALERTYDRWSRRTELTPNSSTTSPAPSVTIAPSGPVTVTAPPAPHAKPAPARHSLMAHSTRGRTGGPSITANKNPPTTAPGITGLAGD